MVLYQHFFIHITVKINILLKITLKQPITTNIGALLQTLDIYLITISTNVHD